MDGKTEKPESWNSCIPALRPIVSLLINHFR